MCTSRKVVVGLLLTMVTTFGVLAADANAHHAGRRYHAGHVVAQKYMRPRRGGHLSSPGGVAITVPAHVMRHAGWVRITSFRHGLYDVHIYAPWRGTVLVTLPLRGPHDRVLHDLGGMWVPESAHLGQRTVRVTQLSFFTDLVQKAKGLIQGKLCLYTSLVKIVECAGDHLDSELMAYIESKLPHNCVIELLEGADPLGVAEAALSGDCVGQAGETGFHVPPNPSAASTPAASPSPSGSSTPSSPSAGESEPTSGEPAPSPPSPPTPAKSIEIGWSSAHPSWIWMTFTGFSTGAHQYTCAFASGGDATYTLTETESPQMWDNERTCYDEEPGDNVWVESEGVRSNAIVVP
jgi:hypothetical protein